MLLRRGSQLSECVGKGCAQTDVQLWIYSTCANNLEDREPVCSDIAGTYHNKAVLSVDISDTIVTLRTDS
jgi:hypothetical protein